MMRIGGIATAVIAAFIQVGIVLLKSNLSPAFPTKEQFGKWILLVDNLYIFPGSIIASSVLALLDHGPDPLVFVMADISFMRIRIYKPFFLRDISGVGKIIFPVVALEIYEITGISSIKCDVSDHGRVPAGMSGTL